MLCLPTFHRLLKRKLCGRDACGLALKCISSHVCSNVPVRIRIFSMYFLSSVSTIAKEYMFLEREASYSEVHKVLARTTEHNQIGYSTEDSQQCVCALWLGIWASILSRCGSDHPDNGWIWYHIFPQPPLVIVCFKFDMPASLMYKTILLLFSYSVFQHPIDSSTHSSMTVGWSLVRI